MKRVLIVSPNWPPVTLPDMHRVRIALPFLGEWGWEPLILKVDPDEQSGPKDPLLTQSIPAGTQTWQAGHVGRWCRINDIGIRSLFHLARLGQRIIREEHPSLVFVSTTTFPLMSLARYWRQTEGVPYVLDFQDPWWSDYRPSIPGTSFSWKSALSKGLARCLEPITLHGVSHVISVSPQYVTTFQRRYPDLRADQFTVLPFGATETDFNWAREHAVGQNQFPVGDGRVNWVYVGRGGTDMAFALRALFKAFQDALQREPRKWERVHLYFIGTDYASGNRARKTIEPIAQEFGIVDRVHENPHRIPYFEALRCLMDADALVVPGSDDPGYSASKIYPYILARKPLLAIFHAEGLVPDILQRTRSGTLVTFTSQGDYASVAQAIQKRWLDVWPVFAPATDWKTFEPYSAREMTRTLCHVFDLSSQERSGAGRAL